MYKNDLDLFGGVWNNVIGWCGAASDFFEARGCHRLSRAWYRVYDKLDDWHFEWICRR